MKNKLSFEQQLEANAALTNICNKEQISQSAQDIINLLCNTAPQNNTIQFSQASRNQDKGHVTAGATNLGNVSFKEEQPKVSRTDFGFRYQRIGDYKIWRDASGSLAFCHFWKADITTRSLSDPSIVYIIRFDQATNLFIDCGIVTPCPSRFKFSLFGMNFKLVNKVVVSLRGQKTYNYQWELVVSKYE